MISRYIISQDILRHFNTASERDFVFFCFVAFWDKTFITLTYSASLHPGVKISNGEFKVWGK